MSLVLQSSGGGSVTLEEPVTASNFTITVPAVSGTMATVDGSGNASVTGNLSFNSGYGSSAVAYGCRAWVNFNGTGTVAIRGSGNVSSITDNGTGDYTVNFTTVMPDVNYSVVSMGGTFTPTVGNGNILGIYTGGVYSTSAVRLSQKTLNAPASPADIDPCLVAVFR